jgi:hypothetical protein
MANANAKRLAPVTALPGGAAEHKLEQIAAALISPVKVTPAMLRIKIRAIYEGVEIPADRKAFVALAVRAGVGHNRRYEAWREFEPGVDDDAGEIAGRLAYLAREAKDALPQVTALYRYYDEADLLLYVGISDGLYVRVNSHIDGSTWMEFAARSTIERYPTRAAAIGAEEAAIKAERPLFNHQHNSSAEAQKRLVEYLIRRDRPDLLTPSVSRG